MSLDFRALGGALRLAGAGARRTLNRDLAAPAEAQSRLLTSLIARIARTEYGHHHGAHADDDYAAFRAKIPIVSYDELLPWMERQRASERRVLVDGTVRCYEPTSGSAGAVKLIPYNDALLSSFRRMFLLWCGDALRHYPLVRGRIYLSVSPAIGPRAPTAAGRPVGFADDGDYLSPLWRRSMQRYLATSGELKRLSDPMAFREALAAQLVACGDLEIVSVWNASAFTVVLAWIVAERERLVWSLRRAGGGAKLQRRLEVLRSVRSEADLPELWPDLRLVSAWASGHARPSFETLRRLLPQAELQPKGLLSTEAPVTIPWTKAAGFVPLLGEVFLEFEDAKGGMHRLHELEDGETYALILTQASGLSRYRTDDLVRVTHRFAATPCLEFVGRGSAASDLVGEKLSDGFVSAGIAGLLARARASGCVVSVCDAGQKPRYRLLVERTVGAGTVPSASEFDGALCAAHHYRLSRHLGQLDQADVLVVEGLAAAYLDVHQNVGMKLGDIKPRALLGVEMSRALLEALRSGDPRRPAGESAIHRSAVFSATMM